MTSHAHSLDRGAPREPFNLDSYLARMEAPERADWQRPGDVVAALGLSPGQSVGELGAGSGYFTLRLAQAVGAAGAVFAMDVEPKVLEVLRDRVEQARAFNVVPILGLSADPLLPRAACDLILAVNVIHHIEDRVGLLERLAASLKPGGRIVDVDFHARETPVGPPPEHRLAREELLASAEAAGLALTREHSFLPYQYFLTLEPRRI